MIKKGRFVWAGLSWSVLRGWKPMIRLGLSGSGALFAEICLFEIASFVSQFDGSTVLSVILINVQIIVVLLSVTIGIQCATAAHIGGALSEGNAKDVRQYQVIAILNT